MKIEASKCNWCGNATLTPRKQVGWIEITRNGLSISGNGKTERYSSSVKSIADHVQYDFCCIRCFMKWLYFSEDTKNNKSEEDDVQEISELYQMINDEIGIKKEN